MGRKKQDKHSDSYWINHHPECNRNLFHIIKYHPLLSHFFERLAYKRGGDEISAPGTVPLFPADRKKELNLLTENSNVIIVLIQLILDFGRIGFFLMQNECTDLLGNK
ncbi:hypothetical protein CR513_13275, partial [Mucuna pruriens]